MAILKKVLGFESEAAKASHVLILCSWTKNNWSFRRCFRGGVVCMRFFSWDSDRKTFSRIPIIRLYFEFGIETYCAFFPCIVHGKWKNCCTTFSKSTKLWLFFLLFYFRPNRCFLSLIQRLLQHFFSWWKGLSQNW